MGKRVRYECGTDAIICSCGSWLKHWKEFSGKPLSVFCAAASCRNSPTIGAHVQVESPNDTRWYVIPLCNQHSVKRRTLTVMESTVLVPADVHLTCGK
jgi:hypothetical protein